MKKNDNKPTNYAILFWLAPIIIIAIITYFETH